MKKEYCKPILDVVSYDLNRSITALNPSGVLNGNDAASGESESFGDVIWE